MEEKKVITMENRENECENNDEVLEEVIEKESLFNKAKRFVKSNKKKILATGALNIMALTTSRSISLSGQSIINGITVETYNASVSETNPESMYINQSTVNHEMRKANRAQCRKDRDEFEELAYSIQDEIISKVATAKED